MIISELIVVLETLKAARGDIEVMIDSEYSINHVRYQSIDPQNYPKEWHMPNELIELGTNR